MYRRRAYSWPIVPAFPGSFRSSASHPGADVPWRMNEAPEPPHVRPHIKIDDICVPVTQYWGKVPDMGRFGARSIVGNGTNARVGTCSPSINHLQPP